jgi:hypothetical protein
MFKGMEHPPYIANPSVPEAVAIMIHDGEAATLVAGYRARCLSRPGLTARARFAVRAVNAYLLLFAFPFRYVSAIAPVIRKAPDKTFHARPRSP